MEGAAAKVADWKQKIKSRYNRVLESGGIASHFQKHKRHSKDSTETEQSEDDNKSSSEGLPSSSSHGEEDKSTKRKVEQSLDTTESEHRYHYSQYHVDAALILIVLSALLYHTWANRAYIAANQIPVSVFLPWLVVAYLVGFGVDEYEHINQKDSRPDEEDQRRSVLNATERRRRASLGCEVHIDGHATTQQDGEGRTYVSRTRRFIHRVAGRRHHLSAKTTRTSDRINSFVENQLFFTTLSPKKAFEEARLPFSDDAFMHHLLKYSDFKRKKKYKRDQAHYAVEEIGNQEKKILSKEESLALLGEVDLKNADAQSLVEECEQFAEEVVEPVFSLRGMDMFLGDEPEELIYRQPLLINSGLRKTPTFVGNLMMPFGNMTVYFKMPKWVEDWSNLPDETEDDAPDIRALKRWLSGDDEYRLSRLKVIPYIVDGPIAIRLIKPKAAEVTVHGEKTPVKFAMVPGNKNDAPLMECDIDLVSNATIRKLVNMIRGHLKSIVIDVAFIISKPSGSTDDEPSCCLGCWRIDRIDFEKAGVFPEKPLEEIADTMKEVFAH